VDPGIPVRPGHRLGELPRQIAVDRVQNLRTIQGDPADAAILLEQNFGHLHSLAGSRRVEFVRQAAAPFLQAA
jgi:hypothetical protein